MPFCVELCRSCVAFCSFALLSLLRLCWVALGLFGVCVVFSCVVLCDVVLSCCVLYCVERCCVFVVVVFLVVVFELCVGLRLMYDLFVVCCVEVCW